MRYSSLLILATNVRLAEGAFSSNSELLMLPHPIDAPVLVPIPGFELRTKCCAVFHVVETALPVWGWDNIFVFCHGYKCTCLFTDKGLMSSLLYLRTPFALIYLVAAYAVV